MNENTTNTPDDDDYGFVDMGFAIDVLSFSFGHFGFGLFNYTQLQGSFTLLEIAYYDASATDKSRSLLAFNPRPIPVETNTYYMFDMEHVSVDILFMRFMIKKPVAKK